MSDSFQSGVFPLVSVVIPAYNSGKYIYSCIASVLDQDYPHMEVIVVDDGSTDNTAEIVEKFGEQIKYVWQKNSGSAVARNRAIEEASGMYIAFCDSDDLWVPNHLRLQIDFLENNHEFGVVTGEFCKVDANFKLEDTSREKTTLKEAILDPERSGWVYHSLFESSWYHIIATVVRRQVIKRIRFNPDYRRGQDYDFWFQLAHHTQIAKLRVLCAYYRTNEESVTHKPHLRNYGVEIIENNLIKFGHSSRDGRSISNQRLNSVFHRLWFEQGYQLFGAAWYREALKAFWKSWRYSPGRVRSYKMILRCFFNLARDRSPS